MACVVSVSHELIFTVCVLHTMKIKFFLGESKFVGCHVNAVEQWHKSILVESDLYDVQEYLTENRLIFCQVGRCLMFDTANSFLCPES